MIGSQKQCHTISSSVKTPEKERVLALLKSLSPKKRAYNETVVNSTFVGKFEEDSLLLSITAEVMMPIMIKAQAQEN